MYPKGSGNFVAGLYAGGLGCGWIRLVPIFTVSDILKVQVAISHDLSI